MDEKERSNGYGVTLNGDEVPQSYRVDPRVEYLFESTAPPVSVAPPSTEVRKKRGRPRKNEGDGSVVALSPMPISASFPFTGDYPPGWKPSSVFRPVELKKKHELEIECSGAVGPMVASLPVSGGFTPHMITVNTGEDIMVKVISFYQQGSRAICILAANGIISSVTLHQPSSSGGTLTYEGCFEILSLTGSFIPNDNGPTKSSSGGMSVSLAGPDGRVLGGGLAGMLIAAGPVQIVIGSFVAGQQQEEQEQEQQGLDKKPKYEQTISFVPIDASPIPEQIYEASYNGLKPNLTSSASFRGDNVAPMYSVHGPKITANPDNKVTGF